MYSEMMARKLNLSQRLLIHNSIFTWRQSEKQDYWYTNYLIKWKLK